MEEDKTERIMAGLARLEEQLSHREGLLKLISVLSSALAVEAMAPAEHVSTIWPRIFHRVNEAIGFRLRGEAPPGSVVDDWLRSLDPNKLEAMWLSGDDFVLGKGESFLQKLRDLARADPGLWPEVGG